MSLGNSVKPEKAFQVLFVCTGNTCRSPMAESLCAQMLARELNCGQDLLTDHGFAVASAGLMAAEQCPASHGAQFAMAQVGEDLSRHRSRLLTGEMIAEASLVLTMTTGHLQAIQQRFGPLPGKVHLLGRNGSEILDPFGLNHQAYERCRDDIAFCLAPWKESILSPIRSEVI